MFNISMNETSNLDYATKNFWRLPSEQPLVIGPPFNKDMLTAAMRIDQTEGNSFPEFLQSSNTRVTDFVERHIAYFEVLGEE